MFRLTFVTAEKKIVLDQEIEQVSVPGYKGEINILPGHSPLITTLDTGILKWKLKNEEKEQKAVISWGYCEVHPDGVDILADIADMRDDVNVKECKDKIIAAEKLLAATHLDDEAWDKTRHEVMRSRSDIELLN